MHATVAMSLLAIISFSVASDVQWTKEYQVRIGAHHVSSRHIPNHHTPR